ncbi:hypothetical protein GDO86_004629 [Hymenochirus boettgeri]|uniref:TNFR-Cys domain-containing protein n=1 Tax=Hymenochirus boettgeri TaxID=247094 RepID=A0A8T2K6R6_9PIPI|nr:hypothetical protein GDO86_004629 [Hymenochirus boettgeri]
MYISLPSLSGLHTAERRRDFLSPSHTECRWQEKPQVSRSLAEVGDCREQEFFDNTGNCRPCQQCGPGKEPSKECGFGYGEDAQCLPCRPNRFKEDWGFQKCKPCLDCATVNRFQKANCTPTSNALCGECLPGFYRKSKLGGFQDMECVPCGDTPPPYEPHCNTKVNLVKIPSTASRSKRSQELQYTGSELLCFDRPQVTGHPIRTYCNCQHHPSQACGPVHLIPSLVVRTLQLGDIGCLFRSHSSLFERNEDSLTEMIPTFFGPVPHTSFSDIPENWPLMQTSGTDTTCACEPDLQCTGVDTDSLEAEELNIKRSLCHYSSRSSDIDREPSPVLKSSHSSQLLHLTACQAVDGTQTDEEEHSDSDEDKQVIQHNP